MRKQLARFVVWGVTAGLAGGMSLPAYAGLVFIDDFAGDPTTGRFVMEAEHFADRRTDAGGGWWEVSGITHLFVEGPRNGEAPPNVVPGARESYMEVLRPATPAVPPIGSSYNLSTMEYRVAIEASGAYHLWVRWRGDSPSTDSLYASIWKSDGTLLRDGGPLWFTFHQWRSSWIWDHRGLENSVLVSGMGFPDRAIWTISEPGTYIVRISQRESETAIDALILQTENLAAPVGLGPPESQREEETQPLHLDVDIRPGTCRNPLNLKSGGKIFVAVLGRLDLDVREIDVESIRFAKASPLRAVYRDVGAPVENPAECACQEQSPDGLTDLVLLFSTQEVALRLAEQTGNLVHRERLGITLDATVMLDQPVSGTDCAMIVGTAALHCTLP